MEKPVSIPITISFSGSVTYLVKTSSYELAAQLAERSLGHSHPRVHIESVLIMDPSETTAIYESGQEIYEIELEG